MVIQPIDTADMDAMRSFVRYKGQQRWLWHAIAHHSDAVLADVFGPHTDTVFLQRKQLLAPMGISQVYADDWGTYQRHLNSAQQAIGKEHTQKMERQHLPLRPRIKRFARKMLCLSKSVCMHDMVMGLFMKRDAFGLPI